LLHAAFAYDLDSERVLGRIDDSRLATIHVAMPGRRVMQTSDQIGVTRDAGR
jgi:hypothetical protein